MSRLTEIELKEWLQYTPETGAIVWLKGRRSGCAAGTKSRDWNIIMINGTPYRSARCAWALSNGEWPQHRVEPINGDYQDLRLENLRLRAPNEPLTLEQARSMLKYDENTGELTIIKSPRRDRIGSSGFDYGFGYKAVSVNGRRMAAHRVIWFIVHGKWPEHDIDHINGDRSDNRLSNLREATRSQNLMNRSVDRRNKSGVTGVCWSKRKKRWRAYISSEGNTKSLGLFSSIEDAAKKRREHEAELFGQFRKAR